jgi:hypothetical protein
MKRVLMSIVTVILLAAAAHAQEATLTTPETVAATKVVVREFKVSRQSVEVSVEFRTASDAVKRFLTYSSSETADIVSFLGALRSARAGETGTDVRRVNFRILGWLRDNNRLTDEAGQVITVTLVP